MKHNHAYKRTLGISVERGTWLLAGLCLTLLPALILISEVTR